MVNEVVEGGTHRVYTGQALSLSHPFGKAFAISGQLWHFTQPILEKQCSWQFVGVELQRATKPGP
jgi:hypothetical protein